MSPHRGWISRLFGAVPVFGSGPSYPDGYNETTITDPDTAMDQHVSALFARDNFTKVVNSTEHTLDMSQEITSQVNVANERAALRVDGFGDASDSEVYHAENTSYVKQTGVSEPGYSAQNESFSQLRESMSESDLKKQLTDPNYEGTGTVTRNDETLFRYNATSVDDADGFLIEQLSTDNIESFNATLLVDEEGIIRSLTATIAYSFDSETYEATIRYHITDIDSTTVEEPDWLEEAKSESEDPDPFEDEF